MKPSRATLIARSMWVGVLIVFPQFAWACPTCGGKGFTKEMLFMTMVFALLPLSIMLALAWRIVREDEEGNARHKRGAFRLGKKNPDVRS